MRIIFLLSILFALCIVPLYAEEKKPEVDAVKKAENEKRANAFILLAKQALEKQKTKEAFEYYLLAAKHGNADAQAVVGNCYYHGSWGVEKDVEKAIHWFRRAAKQGNNVAQAQLSRCLGSGTGFNEKKPKRAAKMNKKSQY